MKAVRADLLVVDDDEAVRTFLAERLSTIGHRVRSVADGFSALQEIRRQEPEIVLSDLNMPRMSGFELLSVVRRRFPSIRVVAMSGEFMDNDFANGVAADAFYEKGTPFGKLLLTIEALSDPDLVVLEGNREKPAAVWVEGNGHHTKETQVMIGCPECFRVFPEVLKAEPRQVTETSCAYCESMIQYAIVPVSRKA
jgi:CheY-like chemotaxis protein